MKVIPLNGDQVKGSHGRDRVPANQQPVFIGPASLPEIRSAQDVHEAILSAFEKSDGRKPACQRASGRGSYSRPGTSR